MKKKARFSVVELLIVVGIIGGLSMCSMPACSPEYLNQMRVKRSIEYADDIKSASVDFYQKHGRFPKNNSEAGLPDSIETTEETIKSIEIREGGVIKITYNEKLKYNAVLTLKAVLRQDGINWVCFKNDKFERVIMRNELPKECRDQIYGKKE